MSDNFKTIVQTATFKLVEETETHLDRVPPWQEPGTRDPQRKLTFCWANDMQDLDFG